MEIKELNNMWVCVGPHNYPDYSSISYKRKGSIKKLIKDTQWSWRKFKTKGWKCVKVSITFKIA